MCLSKNMQNNFEKKYSYWIELKEIAQYELKVLPKCTFVLKFKRVPVLLFNLKVCASAKTLLKVKCSLSTALNIEYS